MTLPIVPGDHGAEGAHSQNLYEAVGGEPTFELLVRGFYAQVPGDDILGPMYPEDDMAGAHERLKWFLIQLWGGPAKYQEDRGHPRLRMRHAHYHIDPAAAQRWVDLMENSMRDIDETIIPPAYRHQMSQHFQRVATMLINAHGQ